MLLKKKNKAPSIQGQIEDVILEMGNHKPGSEEHNKLFGTLRILNEMLPKKEPFRISGDAIASAGVLLLTTAMVLHHEKFEIIASKAWNGLRIPKL